MDDDRLRDLLRSPLDEPPERRSGAGWFLLGLVAVAGAVGLFALLRSGAADPAPTSLPGATGPAAASSSASSTTSTQAGTVGYPPDAFQAAMEYDPGTERMVLFGGATRAGVLGETWALDLAAGEWRRMAASPAPPPRVEPATAFDTERGRIVLFGGAAERLQFCSPIPLCSGSALGDTWLYDPAADAWTEVSVPGPEPRVGHAMAYDPAADKVVLFGGGVQSAVRRGAALGDTWIFDPATNEWAEASPAVSPPERTFADMAYDSESERVMLWGGSAPGADDDGLWTFDTAGGEWARVPAGEAPVPRWFHDVVAVPDRGELLVIGGNGAFTQQLGEGITATRNRATEEVWAWEAPGRGWRPGAPAPQQVTQAAAAYHDGLRQVVVFFGGHTFTLDPATGAWEDRSADLGATFE